MDPERDTKYADYLLSDGQRKALKNDLDIGEKETDKAEKIRERASNLDLRVQYLFEDIELLYHSGVLEQLDVWNLKADLEEIDLPLQYRRDSPILEHEQENPDGVNVSPFGIALGHILSLIYPGDSTEQTRLWWGLVLGYFGHPAREIPQPYTTSNRLAKKSMILGSRRSNSDSSLTDSETSDVPSTPAQNVLSTVTEKFHKRSKDEIGFLQDANLFAEVVLNEFGVLLYEDLEDGKEIEDVSDFRLHIQAVIVATLWGRLTEKGLTNAYHHSYKVREGSLGKDETPSSIIEECIPVATESAVESLTKTHVGLDILEEIDQLCRHVVSDIEKLGDLKGRGVVGTDVFELLRNADEPLYASDINREIQKGANNVKWILNKLSNQSGDPCSNDWSYSHLSEETANGFQLTQYGELLGHLHFEVEKPRTELYALAFNEDIRFAFDIDERTITLVGQIVENDVPFDSST